MLLLLGTFFDEAIAAALYSPQNVPATIITTIGIYPFSASIVFFMGVMYQRVAHSKISKAARVVVCIVIALLALAIGFVGAGSLVDEDCLGGILPGLIKNIPVIAVLTLVVECPLFFVAYRVAERTDDELLLKRAIALVILMVVVFISMRVFKSVFNRPRYRTVVAGYEGIGFVPWYRAMPNPSELMGRYGLSSNEFSSFPSGHSILSISTIYILYSLAWVFPGLRGKKTTLCMAGFLFAIVIMFTRMMLGAHYLSDVSAGALIGIVYVLIYEFVQRRIGDA